jgi:hypothetical protein
MNSHPLILTRAESLEQGIERIYKFSELLNQLEKILFTEAISVKCALTPQEPKYFFYMCDSHGLLKQQDILKVLLDIKKVVGKDLF